MKLADVFTDHMVLQREIPIALFGEGLGHGTATLGDTVTEFEAKGPFLTYLPAMPAGGPFDLTVTIGDKSATFTDVLIGDVYLAGGQSNMQFRVEESSDIPRIPNPRVRVYTEGHGSDENRNVWCDQKPWQVATADALESFTAIGYDVGRMLCEELDVPVGILSCNIGASRVDAWTAPELVNAPDYQVMLGKKHGDWHYYQFNQDSWCYLTKLLPLVPYTIRGVLWYQGESNRLKEEAVHYHTLLGVLIKNWRTLWGTELPFYVVQIAPFADNPDNDWAHIRQGQERATKEIPGTYLCTLVHTGEAENIHPTKKHQLAVELKNAVLATAFGYDLEYCGPVVDRAEKIPDGALITFTHAVGLHFDGEPTDLHVYDKEGASLPFSVVVKDNALTVTAPGAAQVEMGFCNAPTHNLYNESGYIASPFQILL